MKYVYMQQIAYAETNIKLSLFCIFRLLGPALLAEWKGVEGAVVDFSLNSRLISHNFSAHCLIEGLDSLEGARQWRASLKTLSTAWIEGMLLRSLGSIATTTSPSLNLLNACTKKQILRSLHLIQESVITRFQEG